MYRKFYFLFSPFLLFGQTTIHENSYAIDSTRSMIVVNQKITDLNTSYPGEKATIAIGDNLYALADPVTHFESGKGYEINLNGKSFTLYFSNLPMIRMTTTREISDSPKILGHFEIKVPETPLISSAIGVEYRGATSQSYPKKSMEIEFWLDDNGNETQEFSLLNLHKGDSYNLQAMYNEKLRINSKTSNELWQKIYPNVHYKNDENDAKSGVQMKYADLFLNGEYRGVYAIGEKVNRKLLKLKKNDNTEIKGELYKGDQWGGATTFTGLIPFDNNSDLWDGYEYKHPKDIIRWENLYNLIDFVLNEDDETFNATYSSKLDVDNMVDYFIFLNLIRATDNTGKNIYLAKYKKDGPYFYVPWDLDGTFGSIWDGTEENVVDDLLFNGLYTRLWQEPGFRSKLAERWAHLRTNIITKENLAEMLNNNMEKLRNSGVYEREARVWEAYEFAPDMINYQTNWLGRRIDFLDSIMKSLSTTDAKLKNSSLSIYPNPASEFFYINPGNIRNADLQIIDFSGMQIFSKKLGNITTQVQIPLNKIPEGIYFVILKGDAEVKTARLIVKK